MTALRVYDSGIDNFLTLVQGTGISLTLLLPEPE
jgi:hypothetical protein